MRVLVAILFLLTACQQNPYDGHHGVEGPKPKVDPAVKSKPVPIGAWGLKVSEQMNFVEGQKSTYHITGSVPTPGLARITVTGLPLGASFDPATGDLTWLPDFQAANDPANPLASERVYSVQVELSSSAVPNSSLNREALIIVTDVPQPTNIKTSLQVDGFEGSLLSHQITFEDLEFPQGPFDAMLTGFPDGVTVSWPDHTVPQFTLNWMPGPQTVQGANQIQAMGGHVILLNPRGRSYEFNVVWNIHDVSVAPLISGPTQVEQSGNIAFMLAAQDQNGEEQPQWQVMNPPSGEFNLQASQMSPNQSTALITWRKINSRDLNQTYPLQVQACVRAGSSCSSYEIDITPTGGK
jgi:hypothetical protein